jgi:hypothetical protein
VAPARNEILLRKLLDSEFGSELALALSARFLSAFDTNEENNNKLYFHASPEKHAKTCALHENRFCIMPATEDESTGSKPMNQ